MAKGRIAILTVTLLFLGLGIVSAETITLWDGVKIEVEVKKVSTEGAVVLYQGMELTLPWLETMTSDEAIRVWRTYMNQAEASQWFDLGMFAWNNNRKDIAKELFDKAIALDPSYKDKSPFKPDPSADKKEILRLLGEAQKYERSSKLDLAIETYEDILDWPNKTVLADTLRETDFLNTDMLEDQLNRLRKKQLSALGYKQTGKKWVTDAEEKLRTKDIEDRSQSARLDATENERRASWDNSWERNGRWYALKTNVPKWYFMRYLNRMDILYDDIQKTLGLRIPSDKKMKVFIYGSRALYQEKAGAIKPGAASLGGFYAEGGIHLFLESDQEDLTYEDISVMSLDYLSASLFLHMLSEDTPFWLDAGLSMYYQDAAWSSALKVDSGKFPNRYARREFRKMLRAGSVYDPAKLFEVSANPTAWDYLCAWATMQYVLDKANPLVSNTFFDGMKVFGTDKAAFKAFLAKADTLKTEVPNYFKTQPAPPVTVTVPIYPMY